MKRYLVNSWVVMAAVLLLASCTKDLDRTPPYGNTAASL